MKYAGLAFFQFLLDDLICLTCLLHAFLSSVVAKLSDLKNCPVYLVHPVYNIIYSLRCPASPNTIVHIVESYVPPQV